MHLIFALLSANPLLPVGDEHVGDPRPTLYVHLHKAGGSTACTAFQRCGSLTTVASPQCNCAPFSTSPPAGEALLASDANAISTWMAEKGVSLCMVEDASKWPPASVWQQLKRQFKLVITLREPFARFWSSYERDFDICGRQSVQEYYLRSCKKVAPHAYHGIGSGSFGVHMPNFYVHALTGTAHAAPDGGSYESPVVASDLAAAKDALRAFDDVLILEESDWMERLWAVAGCPGRNDTIQRTNNDVPLPDAAMAQHDNETFVAQWRSENALDIELYEFSRGLVYSNT